MPASAIFDVLAGPNRDAKLIVSYSCNSGNIHINTAQVFLDNYFKEFQLVEAAYALDTSEQKPQSRGLALFPSGTDTLQRRLRVPARSTYLSNRLALGSQTPVFAY